MQGDLFSGYVSSRRPGGVAPAQDGPLTAAPPLPPELRLGTSSWTFPGWEGLVYAREYGARVLAAEGLEAYAAHPVLRTVGVDRGYYRPLSREILAKMASQVPGDFRFVVKAPVQVTGPRLRGAGPSPNPDFLHPGVATTLAVKPYVQGLGDRAGVLLFQFPPMGIRSPDGARRFLTDLGSFLRALPSGPVYGVEVRDRVLWGQDFRRVLQGAGAVPGYAVHPTAPPLADQLAMLPPGGFPVTLVRWLLPHGSDYEEARAAFTPFRVLQAPDPQRRNRLVGLALDGVAAGRPTFIIVNNKAEGSAPLSVLELAAALGTGG